MKYLIAATLGLSLTTMSACSKPAPSAVPAGPAVSVTTAQAAEMDLHPSFEAGGAVRARSVAAIVSRIMADVKVVAVKAGDRVRAGQPLVYLDARELDANRSRATAGQAVSEQGAALADADRQAADAALTLARVTHQRIADLRAKNSATPHELDEAVAGLRAAEARLKVADARAAEARAAIASSTAAAAAARVASSYATLVAPFDGLVTEKLVDPGNMASPGQPLITVEDTRSFRLDVRLDESRAALIRVGQSVQVQLDPTGTTDAVPTAGTVIEIARMMDPGSHDFVVKIDLPAASGLRSGMFGRAVFKGEAHKGLAVPATALTRRGQLQFVYVVDADKRARLRLVNASEAADGVVEVRSGLVAGERVVTTPPAALTDGAPVTMTATAGGGR